MSKQINPRKVRQYERFINQYIEVNGGAKLMFLNFKNTPNLNETINMFKSGMFGIEHPFNYASSEFALEYAFDEFNEVFELILRDKNWNNKSDAIDNWNIFLRAQDEPWGNLVFSIWIDKVFAPFVSKLDRDEFITFTDDNLELIHDQTRSIVFDFKYMGILNKDDHFYTMNKDHINFRNLNTKGKTMFHYGIWVASADLYDEYSNAKNLKKRESLISVKVPWDGTSSYIVYTAKDSDGTLRYVGEGKSDRYLHVNSGTSHNYKLNEHFFLKGKMDVEVVRDSLTKPKALAVEKFLISRYRNTLWNIRDNPNAKKT